MIRQNNDDRLTIKIPTNSFQCDDGDERLSVAQAAEILGVHENTIRNLLLRGDLYGERIGKRIIRIRKSDLEGLFTPFVGGEHGVWK